MKSTYGSIRPPCRLEHATRTTDTYSPYTPRPYLTALRTVHSAQASALSTLWSLDLHMHTRATNNSNSRAVLRLGSPHTARTLKPRDSPQPNYSQQDKPQNSQSQSPNARYVCFARASARVRFKPFTSVCASVQVRNTSRANFSGHSPSSDEEDAPAPEPAPRYLQESARHKTSQESGNVTADGMGTG